MEVIEERPHVYELTPGEVLVAEKMREAGLKGLGWLVVNHYGAICLNATNVMFADIDCEPTFEKGRPCKPYRTWEDAVERILFVSEQDNLRFRVYRTHSGIRLIETSKFHDAGSDQTADLFYRLGCDAAYRELTLEQGVFRVRLTPKPWRIPGPERIDFKHVGTVEKYLNDDKPSNRIAALVSTVGDTAGDIPSDIIGVVNLHDTYCRVKYSALPLV